MSKKPHLESTAKQQNISENKWPPLAAGDVEETVQGQLPQLSLGPHSSPLEAHLRARIWLPGLKLPGWQVQGDRSMGGYCPWLCVIRGE